MGNWFTITAAGGGKPADIFIFDEVDAVGAEALGRQLAALASDQEITLRINSPGGDGFAGLAVYSILNTRQAPITGYIDGVAASAASLIMMAADKIVAPENTFMGIHDARTLAIGTAAGLRKVAEDLERVSQSYAATYAKRSRQSLAAVRALMVEDRMMSATEAKQRGFIDEVTPLAEVVATFDLGKLEPKHGAVASVFAPNRARAASGEVSRGARRRMHDPTKPADPKVVESWAEVRRRIKS